MEKLQSTIVSVAAIAAICTLEIVALLKGFDGQLLTMTVAALAAAAGWHAQKTVTSPPTSTTKPQQP